MSTMRAKVIVQDVNKEGISDEGWPHIYLTLNAVCGNDSFPEDGVSEDNTYSKWTPDASLKFTITNPALFDSFNIGDKFYVDFTPAV